MDAKRWLIAASVFCVAAAAEPFQLDWKDGMLTISKPGMPGGFVEVWYIEAFCRSDAHDAEWSDTVIPHDSILVKRSDDGNHLELRSLLENNVAVEHEITAEEDAVSFRVHIYNPTLDYAEVHWAQPCIRVGPFTGTHDPENTSTYEYLPKSFVFIDNELTRMPTPTWATEARYTPGQVWRAPHVDGKDVNPRPLNPDVPSNGLIGCFSENEDWILATAWEPYHELFQGVITCLHSDFHIGGLKPRERKNIRGAIYIFQGDEAQLLEKYRSDFPEHAKP